MYMNPKTIRFLALSLTIGLLFSMPVHAQVAGAKITGAITDVQGGAIADARVSVRNVSTNVLVETSTNASGVYTVPNLNAGDYEVSISASGFSTAVSKVALTVGAKRMNLSLAVGQVTQQVIVTDAAPQAQWATSTISGNVQIRLIGRSLGRYSCFCQTNFAGLPVKRSLECLSYVQQSAPSYVRSRGNCLIRVE